MIILGCDVSYQAFGITIYNTELNSIIYNNTITFNSLSALSKREIELWQGMFLDKISNIKKVSDDDKKSLKEYWNNIRLHEFYKEILRIKKLFNIDAVVVESQFSSTLSDVFAVVRLASIDDNSIKIFKAYNPQSWHRILLGYGRLTRVEAKKIVKDKISKYWQLKSQDEYDSFALILTFLKENDIIVNNEVIDELDTKRNIVSKKGKKDGK